MKIDIHIPTRQRPKVLNDCLNSIQRAMEEGVHVYVWFDSGKELEEFRIKYNWIDYYWLHFRILTVEFIPPLFWNARLQETKADVFMYLCDDTEVDVECIRQVKGAFRAKFPDFDGVVGIRQANLPALVTVPAAFGAIGMKFADRFAFRNVFCPEYLVFYIDYELGKFADGIGKFHFCESAFLLHHTPGSGAETDGTNRWIRRNKQHDVELNAERRRRKLLWGRDFNLVTGK